MPTFPWIVPHAAYIHIPFCAHHCSYCDFAIATKQDHKITQYLEALEIELASLGQPTTVQTIFLGGGTPSHLPVQALQRLFAMIRHWLPLCDDGEFSLEANPDDMTPERLDTFAQGGINRVSLGIQSFEQHHLETLDRRHSASQVHAAIERVAGRFPNFSLDLIFGIPGQTLADWKAELELAVSYAPRHISTYGLTFEKGTPLWKKWHGGEIARVPEELEEVMYLTAMEFLGESDFEQYEISNFARPGSRCRHNETYWANHAYYGFGMGAMRYVEGRRELNVCNIDDYIRRLFSGESPTFQSETLPLMEAIPEMLSVQIRRREGISRADFRSRTGLTLDSLLGNFIERHCELNLLVDTGADIRLTRRGKCVADALEVELFRCFQSIR